MKKSIFPLITIFLLSQLVIAQKRDLRFDTKSAMYAANEEWLTFACEVPEGTVDLELKYQTEMYWYSLYSLGNLTLRSGMGVHAVSNPLFEKHAREDKNMPWSKGMRLMRQKKFMLHKVAQFKAKSGAAHLDNMFAGYGPPEGAFPIYLEYASGVPTFVKEPNLEDFGTLRWDKKTFDKTMTPAAWGQTMMKQMLWSRDFFNEHRQSKGVTYLGTGAHDGAHGFRGSMLIAMTLAKSFALKSTLAYNAKTGKLGEVNPMTYDPMKGAIYYPHKYQPVFPMMSMTRMMGAPPVPSKFKVLDKTSDLFDVASLIWATSEFYYLTDPKVKDSFDKLFGDPMWVAKDMPEPEIENALKNDKKTIFPQGDPHKLSMGITAVNFKNIMGLHFNKKAGTLVDSWHPDKMQGKHISTQNAGMAIVALANVNRRLHDVDKIKNGAKMILMAQANFLLKHQDSDGSIANGFSIDGKADKGSKTLLSQSFAIRGWLAAYQLTKDNKFLEAAERTYNFMQKELWSESAGVFRTHVGAQASKYNGMVYGAALGALRELAIARNQSQRTEITAQIDEFFYNVKNKAGLQIAEINMTGEMIPSKEMATQMMAKMAEMEKSDPKKAMEMKKMMMDSDKDGVPKPKFVMGTSYGAAPVTAGSVTISTKK